MATTSLVHLMLFGAAVLLVSAQTPSPAARNSVDVKKAVMVNEICMGCICEAASNCDRTLGCHDGVCGLFAITKPYWIDAGKPIIRGDVANNVGAFERCTTDPVCAANTVQAYMSKYSKDCDHNGVISCQDFAAIHSLGVGCPGRLDPDYKQQLDQCLVRFMTVKT